MSHGEEHAGYYCLLIAILCGLNAAEARKLYEYGPEHPLCRKIQKKKVKLPGAAGLGKEQAGHLMKKFLEKGYTVDAVAEAFGCYPSTVRRRAREAEKADRNYMANAGNGDKNSSRKIKGGNIHGRP